MRVISVPSCVNGPGGIPCGRASVGPMTSEQCPRCWIKLTGGRAKTKPVRPIIASKAIPECHHRGEPTGETVACKTCRGNVQMKVFACSKHGRCTLGKSVEGVHRCDAR